jgi:hypothetical protein
LKHLWSTRNHEPLNDISANLAICFEVLTFWTLIPACIFDHLLIGVDIQNPEYRIQNSLSISQCIRNHHYLNLSFIKERSFVTLRSKGGKKNIKGENHLGRELTAIIAIRRIPVRISSCWCFTWIRRWILIICRIPVRITSRGSLTWILLIIWLTLRFFRPHK